MSGIKFSNTTPAAPGGMSLVQFQADGQGHISAAYTPGGGGGGATAVAGEALLAGAFVYIKASDGKLYNAVWASGGNEAIGFVTSAFSLGATATYFSTGAQNTALTALTVGARYYGNKATPGAVTTTVPTGTGVLSQFIGHAVSATTIQVDLADAIILSS